MSPLKIDGLSCSQVYCAGFNPSFVQHPHIALRFEFWDPQSVDLLFGFLQFSPGAAETHGLVTWYQDYQVRSTCGLGIVKKTQKNIKRLIEAPALTLRKLDIQPPKPQEVRKASSLMEHHQPMSKVMTFFAPTYPDSDPNLRDSKPSTTINQSENHPKKHDFQTPQSDSFLPWPIETCQISLACCSSCSDKPGVIFRLGSDQPTNRNGP